MLSLQGKEPLCKKYSKEEKIEFADLFGEETDEEENEPSDNKQISDSPVDSDVIEVQPPPKSPQPVIDLTADSDDSDDGDTHSDRRLSGRRPTPAHMPTGNHNSRKPGSLEHSPSHNSRKSLKTATYCVGASASEDQCRELFNGFKQPSKSADQTTAAVAQVILLCQPSCQLT